MFVFDFLGEHESVFGKTTTTHRDGVHARRPRRARPNGVGPGQRARYVVRQLRRAHLGDRAARQGDPSAERSARDRGDDVSLFRRYANGFEVYTSGTENPWVIFRGNYAVMVWTWREVEAIVGVEDAR